MPDLSPMRLLLDHGTLVLAETPDLSLDLVPGLLCDDRVAICIDERRGCADSDIPPNARLVRYKNRSDPAVVLSIIAG